MRTTFNHQPSTSNLRSAFSLIEVMVVVTLLALIVVALMNVFSNTQQAFRASVTQQDVLEGGRATVEMITSDLRQMRPSGGASPGPVNFSALANYNNYVPLMQSLPGSTLQRTNLLNWFFMLGRQNTQWFGVGYVVDNTNTSPLYPLYRFYATTNLQTDPGVLFNAFYQVAINTQWTNANVSHVMDGVVHLVVRAYDTNGVWIKNSSTNVQSIQYFSSSPSYGEGQFYMYSNTVPAAVELQLGVLEDRTMARAQSLPTTAQRNQYLLDKSGNVHLFRQRVTIQNVDPTAYQ